MPIATFLGTLGSFLAFCLQLSPFPTMIRGLKTGSILSLTISYFIMGIGGSILWIVFGLSINDIFIWGVNLVGVTLFTIYLNIFIYVECEKKTFIIANGGLFMEFIIAYNFFSGNLCLNIAVVFACVWQSVTVITMRKALREKDDKYIDILLACVSLSNFIDWIFYGIIIGKFMISVPNIFCGFFCALNVYIYFWCKGYLKNDNLGILLMKKMFRVEEDEKDFINDNNLKEKSFLNDI